jgi:GH25 family lysozyme M1 (1,4-beta-N-acetylmuramidase)
MLYLGIDIASVDGNKPIDWGAAKAHGVAFAIFRGTYKTWQDPTWKVEAQRARDAGLTVGAYLFPVMDNAAPSAEAQVEVFASAFETRKLGDLPPILDIEFPGGVAKTGKTRVELLTWIREAIQALQDHFGILPMLYTSARVWDGEDADSLNADTYPVDSKLAECPLWLARYPYKTGIDAIGDEEQEKPSVEALPLPPVPKLWKDATNVWIHQYQGDSKHFPGFTSTADLNRFFSLARGSHGERVKWIQERLHIVTDGDFGPATQNAVESYQRVNSLAPTGIVDPRTFALLCWVKLR